MAFGTLIQAQQYKSNVNEAFNHGLMFFFLKRTLLLLFSRAQKTLLKSCVVRLMPQLLPFVDFSHANYSLSSFLALKEFIIIKE